MISCAKKILNAINAIGGLVTIEKQRNQNGPDHDNIVIIYLEIDNLGQLGHKA